MPSEIIVYRDDTVDMVSNERGPKMRFRLIHYGPVRPDKAGMDIKHHKQRLRRRFHRQLKEMWSRSEVLRASVGPMGNFTDIEQNEKVDVTNRTQVTLLDAVRNVYSSKCTNSNGYEWVPLVLSSYSVTCEIEILMLFAGSKPGPLQYGDVDNRVKTIVDALRQPDPQNIVGSPDESEKPFFVLMQDDKLVTKLSVETDQLYRPQKASRRDGDDRIVHASITVTLRPYKANMFNLMFV